MLGTGVSLDGEFPALPPPDPPLLLSDSFWAMMLPCASEMTPTLSATCRVSRSAERSSSTHTFNVSGPKSSNLRLAVSDPAKVCIAASTTVVAVSVALNDRVVRWWLIPVSVT